MGAQFCVNCDAQAGYPHAADCPEVRYFGDRHPDAPRRRRWRVRDPDGSETPASRVLEAILNREPA